jgi:hypothetical protein
MATYAAPAGLNAERKFFLGIALALAICTFAGFSRSYYLMQWTGAHELPWIVHVHGVLFTVWVLLFGLQAGLISRERHDVHVVTGSFGIALAAAMIVLGLFVAVTRSKPPALVPLTVEQFLIFPLVSIGLFALFVGLAFANRHRPDHHKRYMLIASVNVVLPALARMTVLLPFLPRGVLGGMMIGNLFLVALALFDWRSLGRLHRATLIGGGVTLLSEPLRFMIARSDWWPPVARALIPG